MASVLHIAVPDAIRRVQVITLAWMSVEAVVSLFSAWKARSPALLAFGGDSVIELFSAAVVLVSFRSNVVQERVARKTARVAGALLFALATFIVVSSAFSLMGYSEPGATLPGIVVLIAALGIMPWLAKEKRRLSTATGSAALRADATQSAVCSYLSLIALVGLVANAVWHVAWADPVAGLLMIPLVLREGWLATRGNPCNCC
jgi:divalent metal cation (Fe/Co/Zn/Cd) transporter